MTTFRMDHVVIRVRDLEVACAHYATLGFTVTPGGEHPTLGSRNALIPFEDDTYLELIAFKPRPADAPTETSPSAVMRRVRNWETAEEGVVDFAVVPSNIETAIEEARGRGLALEGPFPGGRRRPDGKEVAWQFGIPATRDLPFLCADVTPRELRVPGDAARRHPKGTTGLARIFVAVASVHESAARYRALLGTEPVEDGSVPKSQTEFAVGPTRIALAEGIPTPFGMPPMTHEGPRIFELTK